MGMAEAMGFEGIRDEGLGSRRWPAIVADAPGRGSWPSQFWHRAAAGRGTPPAAMVKFAQPAVRKQETWRFPSASRCVPSRPPRRAWPRLAGRLCGLRRRANATWPKTPWPPIAATCGGSSTGSQGGNIPGLSIRDLADYAAWLHGQELAPASIARHLVSLKVFFRYLQLEGVLKENVAELLGSQKLWQRVPKVLSPDRSTGSSMPRTTAIPVGGATGRCWNCSTPPAAGRRSCRACGSATCSWTKAIASAAARATSSGWCRSAAGRSRRSAPTSSTSAARWRRSGRRPPTGSCFR